MTLSTGPVHDEEQKCALLAYRLHDGQTDKAGRPYIDHPRRVAALVQASGGDWVQVCAAWLHDVMEDCGVGAMFLRYMGVPHAVVDLVMDLSHPKGEPYRDYITRVKASPGLIVKLCDIHDNLDPTRLCYLDGATQRRLRNKYAIALTMLASESICS